ncbi:hypothetical protein O3P69_015484 [Scylla paramamosain]|uniref:Uncharacterized protein n=1 Tax=Scylla paramamosain TaxID=85552 RepID=A0AAW0T8K9_SCYPA
MTGNQKMDYRILKLRRGVEKLESWVSSLEQEVGRSSFLPAEDSLPQVLAMTQAKNSNPSPAMEQQPPNMERRRNMDSPSRHKEFPAVKKNRHNIGLPTLPTNVTVADTTRKRPATAMGVYDESFPYLLRGESRTIVDYRKKRSTPETTVTESVPCSLKRLKIQNDMTSPATPVQTSDTQAMTPAVPHEANSPLPSAGTPARWTIITPKVTIIGLMLRIVSTKIYQHISDRHFSGWRLNSSCTTTRTVSPPTCSSLAVLLQEELHTPGNIWIGHAQRLSPSERLYLSTIIDLLQLLCEQSTQGTKE